MRSFHNYKFKKRTKYLIAVALLAAYLLGFAARAYSPAHISHYAIPIPNLIPIVGKVHTSANTTGGLQATTSPSGPNQAPTFSHSDIITTFFWVGEPADGDNGNISNQQSAWDEQWQTHYGGVDAPSPRSGYLPAAFTPKENPFYFALPYNDLTNNGDRKPSASSCPLAAKNNPYSWCKNSWIAIRHNGKVAYAQWEDAGPFGENDISYVFGSSPPANKQGAKAGLDVSPAVKDYLGLQDVDSCDWGFIKAASVPAGPWKTIITTTPGTKANS